MSQDMERSKRVVEDYKKRKIARSALQRVHELIHAFEQEHMFDRRMARIGLILILVVLAIAAFRFFSGESATLS